MWRTSIEDVFVPRIRRHEEESKYCCQNCSQIKQRRKSKWGLSSGLNIVIVVLLSLPAVKCQTQTGNQNATASGTIQVSDFDEDKLRPIDVGMEPLYFMTKGFLGLIQPESQGSVLAEVADG